MKFLQFILILLALASCSKEDTVQLKVQPSEVLSICMREKIEAFDESEFICESGAAVALYNFQDSFLPF